MMEIEYCTVINLFKLKRNKKVLKTAKKFCVYYYASLSYKLPDTVVEMRSGKFVLRLSESSARNVAVHKKAEILNYDY